MGDVTNVFGGTSSVAYAVNDDGCVAGFSDTSVTSPSPHHAFSGCPDGEASYALIDLGTLSGPTSNAQGININKVVVGLSDTPSVTSHAFIWDETNGIQDLNDLLPAGSGWELTFAYAINDRGQITGYGNVGGEVHAFLLTPIEKTIVGILEELANDISNIVDDGIVKPPLSNRKKALANKIQAIIELVVAADSATDPELQASLYLDAFDELTALRAKMDSSVGGHAGNDWVLDDAVEASLLELVEEALTALDALG